MMDYQTTMVAMTEELAYLFLLWLLFYCGDGGILANKNATLDDLNAMLEKLDKHQVDDLMMSYMEGLKDSVKNMDFKMMFMWSSVAYVLSELLEKLEKK